jgi:hypothetical protein
MALFILRNSSIRLQKKNLQSNVTEDYFKIVKIVQWNVISHTWYTRYGLISLSVLLINQ